MTHMQCSYFGLKHIHSNYFVLCCFNTWIAGLFHSNKCSWWSAICYFMLFHELVCLCLISSPAKETRYVLAIPLEHARCIQ